MRPQQLVLEVTEHLFLGADPHVIAELAALRGAGVRIALDDFGTGYSSFGQLQDLPVDAVKLDKSFIQRIGGPADRSPIVESMIALAHTLGLEVTAEGVETEIQADYLHRFGCDRTQGFLYGTVTPTIVG
ncbi:EAL domain-containing protein (putative c-di-GMP-specific phosphodiesterase class I) [Arthrobacter sp. CAN_A2]